MNTRVMKKSSLAGKRILLVFPTLDLGGAERQGILLAEYLRKQRAEVAICGLFGGLGPQAVRAECARRGIPCLRVTMPEMCGENEPRRGSIRQFMREMRYLAPDVLLPYTDLPNILCGLAWRWSGAKTCIWGQRDGGIGGASKWRTLAIERTPAFASNSQIGAGFLTESLGVETSRVVRIANGTALDPPKTSRTEWREKLQLADGDRAVCMLANVQPLKDHRTLLLAWKRVVKKASCPRSVLVLAGQVTSSGVAMQDFARELGISDSVRWLGAIDDVSGFLAAMDLAVFSSRREGLPNGILEPMAAGLAVAATDMPGAREALADEQLAYLSPPDDAEKLAENIFTLLSKPELRRQLGQANQRRVATHFSVSRIGQAYAVLIADQLSAREPQKESQFIDWSPEMRPITR